MTRISPMDLSFPLLENAADRFTWLPSRWSRSKLPSRCSRSKGTAVHFRARVRKDAERQPGDIEHEGVDGGAVSLHQSRRSARHSSAERRRGTLRRFAGHVLWPPNASPTRLTTKWSSVCGAA